MRLYEHLVYHGLTYISKPYLAAAFWEDQCNLGGLWTFSKDFPEAEEVLGEVNKKRLGSCLEFLVQPMLLSEWCFGVLWKLADGMAEGHVQTF